MTMRGRVPRSRVSHDRWLVSYADFITLLFAFFVVLFAFARADQKKQTQVAQAVSKALNSAGGSSTPDAESSTQQAKASSEELLTPMQVKYDLGRVQHDLSLALAQQISQKTVAMEMGRDGLVISLREAGFFDSWIGHAQTRGPAHVARHRRAAGRHAVRPAHRGPHR